ncbi:MAG: hypothetical protein MRZ86_05870 [Acidaminococcus sp.]|nr:hypothetical protein [Acidaminococcus sp.]MDD7397935.1 hypothetical protein [Bacillota bacterium]MDY5345169.1 hypothetical protein [Eubacteriales bacterium]
MKGAYMEYENGTKLFQKYGFVSFEKLQTEKLPKGVSILCFCDKLTEEEMNATCDRITDNLKKDCYLHTVGHKHSVMHCILDLFLISKNVDEVQTSSDLKLTCRSIEKWLNDVKENSKATEAIIVYETDVQKNEVMQYLKKLKLIKKEAV